MQKMNYIVINILILICLSSHQTQSMQKEVQEKETKENIELWKTIKKRVSVLKELKSHFAKREAQAHPVQQPPANFKPQSLIHLQSLLGANKTEDELIDKAIRYELPGYRLPLVYKIQIEFTEKRL